MRLTRFRGVDGTIFIIPNGDIRLVGNLSRGWAKAVVDLTFPAPVRRISNGYVPVIAAAAHEVATSPDLLRALHGAADVVGLQSADASTITLRVTLLTVPSERDAVTRALREAALAALAQASLWPAEAEPPATPAA